MAQVKNSKISQIVMQECPRSSSLRNQRCPMCGEPPDLEPVKHGQGQGDGFTMPTNETFSVADD